MVLWVCVCICVCEREIVSHQRLLVIAMFCFTCSLKCSFQPSPSTWRKHLSIITNSSLYCFTSGILWSETSFQSALRMTPSVPAVWDHSIILRNLLWDESVRAVNWGVLAAHKFMQHWFELLHVDISAVQMLHCNSDGYCNFKSHCRERLSLYFQFKWDVLVGVVVVVVVVVMIKMNPGSSHHG